MAKKTFGELKGVLVEIIDSNGEVVETSKLRERKGNFTYKLIYNGDPLFVVNPQTLSIRTCIVKYVRSRRYRSTTVTIGYCDKDKNTNFIPTHNDVEWYGKESQDAGIELASFPQNRSKYGLCATTLADALAILGKLKEELTFTKLNVGDSIYIANRITNKVESYRIKRIDERQSGVIIGTTVVTFTLEDNTTVEVGVSKYDTKTSTYLDSTGFSLRMKGCWTEDSRYFAYTTEKEAVSDLNSMIRKYEVSKKKQEQETPQGSEIKIKDSKQNTLHIGDKVAYVRNSGQSSSIGVGIIVKETKLQVQVFDEEDRIRLRKQREERKKRYTWSSNYQTEYEDDGYHYVPSTKMLLIETYKK